MKKCLILTLLLALLCASGALADTPVGNRMVVCNCNEYITLREEPSTSAYALDRIPLHAQVELINWGENGFLQIAYRGQSGYALEKYLDYVPGVYEGRPVDNLSSSQRYNINLFLSNFTEQGFMRRGGSYREDWIDDAALTDFAIEHCWYNRQNRLEWGDYFDYNNVRLPEGQIAPIVEKYFGLSIKPSHSVDYVDYRDGYYYWQETGGHTSDGFACLTKLQKLDGNRYSVWFDIYGMGEDWDNDMCYARPWEAAQAYPYGGDISPMGHAVIDTGKSGLDDRSDWRIECYTVSY